MMPFRKRPKGDEKTSCKAIQGKNVLGRGTASKKSLSQELEYGVFREVSVVGARVRSKKQCLWLGGTQILFCKSF